MKRLKFKDSKFDNEEDFVKDDIPEKISFFDLKGKDRLKESILIQRDLEDLGIPIKGVTVNGNDIELDFEVMPTSTQKSKITGYLKTGEIPESKKRKILTRQVMPDIIAEFSDEELKGTADKYRQMKEAYEKLYGV